MPSPVGGIIPDPFAGTASPTVSKQDGEHCHHDHNDHGDGQLTCVHRSSLCRQSRRLHVKRNLTDALAYPSLTEVRLLFIFAVESAAALYRARRTYGLIATDHRLQHARRL